ncbi:MAG: hypothetical protein ABMA64_21610 [Myxococcota bacterium]
MFHWLAIGWLGCRGPDLPAPVVDRVDPGFAYNGDDEVVSIVGRQFYPQVAVDARQGEADVDPAFRAWLLGPKGGIELARELVGVGIVDDQHLTATVEAGLPVGTYDLEVEGPTGGRGRAVDVFAVTDQQAVRLLLEADQFEYSVPDPAEITLSLADREEDPVYERFEVEITATRPDGGALTLLAGSLSEPQTTTDGRLRGFVDGVATFVVDTTVTGDVDLRVEPLDPYADVLGDSLELSFVPGQNVRVDIRLDRTEDLPSYAAGELITAVAELVDQFGNPVPAPAALLLQTVCSGGASTVEINGPTPLEIVPRFVTDASCPEDHIVTANGWPGESDPFVVVAGPPHHFYVIASPQELQAGDLLTALVDPRDLYNNHAVWDGEVSVVDSLDGLLEPDCAGSGAFLCLARVSRAGTGVTLTVTGDDGLTGDSNGFDVVADDVPGGLVATTSGPAVAGQGLLVEASVVDGWGNPLHAALLGLSAFAMTDELGEADCVGTGFTLGGKVQFSCTFYTARPLALVLVSLPSFGVGAAPVMIEVVNGPLGAVSFSGEGPVTAGGNLSLQVVGTDRWGNPYLVQPDPVVELTEDFGTLTGGPVTLGPTGVGTVSVSMTRAGPTVVRAWQAGVELGASDPITVAAAAATALRITPSEPWAFVGQPLDLSVEAVDTYGNRAAYDGSAEVSSRETVAPDVDLTLLDGVGVAPFEWSVPAFVDTLDATSGALSGSTPVAVVEGCGAAGPEVVATFGGAAVGLACADPGGGATFTADLSASSGVSPLVGYGLAELGGGVVTDSSPVVELPVAGFGPHPLRALVVDDAGCGAELDASGWVGPDDGTPTGPFALSVDDPTLDLSDSTTVSLDGATDCSGDPAAFAEVEVRATGGALIGPVATGSGLVMTLDGNGDGAATWVTDAASSAATLEVHATVGGGSASGRVTATLSGDGVRPTVVDQSPTGFEGGMVSTVHLTLSEPPLASSITPANFWVDGPGVVAVTGATAAGAEVTLTLSPPADGAAGVWSVHASSSVRDLAGNKLGGEWTDLAADYVGAFGATGGALPTLSCTSFEPSSLVLRPDGDPGPGDESDLLSIGVSSASAPAWWVLEVRDGADTPIVQRRVAPTGASDAVVWDARDARGVVVANGPWKVRVAPDDGLGTRGVGCEVTVTVDNPVGTAVGDAL